MFIDVRPLKGLLLGGVRDLVPVPSKSGSGLEETPKKNYVLGRSLAHIGHGTSQLVAIKCVGTRQKHECAGTRPKRKTGPNSAQFDYHNLVIC